MNRAESITHPINPSATGHRAITIRLIVETGLLFFGLAITASYIGPLARRSVPMLIAYLIVLLAQGLTLQRIYIVAHEAAHKKIAPKLWLNDLIGQTILLPLLVPLQIYRKIHYFHQGFNRKDHRSSSLDVFVSPWPVTLPIKIVCYFLWYLGIFAGGFFFHSLVSIVLFLGLPIKQAQKISPAFKHWDGRDRVIAWAQFLSGLALHLGVSWVFGFSVWLYALGLPLVAFAWIWSLLVYVFHYNTSIGDHVRFNVRSIKAHWFFTWLLMNFNQHATHHMYPNIPWYELPLKAQQLPKPFADLNQNNYSLWQAVLHQFKGPIVIYRGDENPTPQLFVHWED